jgi:hypothetical protein
VETKGPTLEEIARIFDGEEAVANINLQQVEKEIALTTVLDHEDINDEARQRKNVK